MLPRYKFINTKVCLFDGLRFLYDQIQMFLAEINRTVDRLRQCAMDTNWLKERNKSVQFDSRWMIGYCNMILLDA